MTERPPLCAACKEKRATFNSGKGPYCLPCLKQAHPEDYRRLCDYITAQEGPAKPAPRPEPPRQPAMMPLPPRAGE